MLVFLVLNGPRGRKVRFGLGNSWCEGQSGFFLLVEVWVFNRVLLRGLVQGLVLVAGWSLRVLGEDR